MTEIVAEISGSHGGELRNALKLIAEAKRAGADTVKFQCFDPGRLAKKREGIFWDGKAQSFSSLFNLYKKTWTPQKWFKELIAQSALVGIPWFSSVFDPQDVAFLETCGCPRYKISAYEMLDGDLINAVKATGKPIVMSVRPREGLTILQASEYNGSFRNLGLSDHTPCGLIARGPMVERHLRLPGVDTPDAEFSATPKEFADYVKAIRSAS